MKTNFLSENQVKEEVKKLVKGAYYRLGYQSSVKTLAKAKKENATIVKQTIVVARFGIEFQNMAVNKDRVTGSMLYGKYEDGDYGYIVTREDGKQQLVAYINQVLESKYYFNGVEVEKQWLKDNGYITTSEPKPNPSYSGRIQPFTTNIFELGKIEA